MIDTFGRNPAAVPTLLQFLTLLPEEVNSNTRIPITVGSLLYIVRLTLMLFAFDFKDDEFRERSAKLLTANAQPVVELLSMYIQASGEQFVHVSYLAQPDSL